MTTITLSAHRPGGQPAATPHLLFAALLVATVGILQPPGALRAQGLDAEGAVETIIDAPVQTEQTSVAEQNERIARAIEASSQNAALVRKKFKIGKVDIVLVEGLAEKGSPVAATLDAYADAIVALRKEIEGSAIFYHAVDSKQILLKDVVAVEFGDADAVTIFVAAPAPG